MKTKKKYLLVTVLFFVLLICYNYRFEIMYYTSTTFGYDENKARRYSFLFSKRPVQTIALKSRNFFNPHWHEKEKLNIALKVKKIFVNYNSPQLDFKEGNYYLNIFESSEASNTYQNQKLEYINIWENKKPLKIWSINMSNKNFLDKSSLEKESKPVQVTPKMCGAKLIYARQDGNIGAVDYRTGKRFWHKKYGNVVASSIRGFFCEYEKNLDTHITFRFYIKSF